MHFFRFYYYFCYKKKFKYILFQNIFSLNYLQSFKLFKGKYMIKEIFKFIISLIDKNSFQIEENKLKIKFILTSMNN